VERRGQVLCCVAAALVGVAADARGASVRPGTAFSGFAQSLMTRPAPVRGTDGRIHLAYELVLTNTTGGSVLLSRIDVRPAGSRRVLLSLAGRALSARVTTFDNPNVGESADGARAAQVESADAPQALQVGPAETRIVWLDVQVRRAADVPRGLQHVVVGMIPRTGERPLVATDVLEPVRTSSRAPVVLSPPLGRGTWYASEGCCDFVGHHRRGLTSVNGRLIVPQRFALDWYLLDSRHRSWLGDPRRIGSYYSFGRAIIASAPGTVVDAQDGFKDQRPPHAPSPTPPITETVGNHVTVRIGPGRYVLYAHMRRGSVRVHRGQSVARGQRLGEIGNSGFSATPHLHFQVSTTPEAFPTDSPPWVFRQFRLTGKITKRIWDDDIGLQPTPVLPFRAAARPGVLHNTMPLDRDVVQFS
jgi:Peptidase family M23